MQLTKPDVRRVTVVVRDPDQKQKSESTTVYDSTPQEVMTEFQRWMESRISKPPAAARRAQPA